MTRAAARRGDGVRTDVTDGRAQVGGTTVS